MSNLFIDIETAPDHTRLHLFDLPQPPETLPEPAKLSETMTIPEIEKFLGEYGPTLPGPWLDSLVNCETGGRNRIGVFKAINGARDALARQRTELSVTPEFCRVVALGWAEGDNDPEAHVVGLPRYVASDGPIDERLLLVEFWHLVEWRKPTVIGFNPVPVEDVDGSMIADLIETEPERVAGYVKSDIEVTRQLYHFYAGYFCEKSERAF